MPVSNPPGGGNGYSGLDFSTVGDELVWWLNPSHITQYFKGGYAGSGENGIDIGLPHGTPVYSFVDGTVVGAGYYGGGGVVSIETKPGTVWYFQHLDLNEASVGDHIVPGQQIGLSGGQLSGGNHPATCCSGGDHIEVGINGPFGSGSIWHPEGPNINPLPLLQAWLSAFKFNDTPTGGSSTGPGGSTTGETSTGTQHCWSLPFGLPSFCINNAVYNWITQPLRWVKLAAGGFMVAAATLMFIVPMTLGPALQVGGAASGQPEIVTAGRLVSRSRGKRVQESRAAALRAAKAGGGQAGARAAFRANPPAPPPKPKIKPIKAQKVPPKAKPAQGGGGKQQAPQQQAAGKVP